MRTGPTAAAKRAATIVIIVTGLLTAACIKDYSHFYHANAGVAVQGSELSVTRGANVVLEVSRFKGKIVSDAAQSFSFLLEVDSRLVTPGRELLIPSEGVRPHLWILNSPAAPGSALDSEQLTENCRGSITISEVSRARIEAKLDVRSEDQTLSWKLKESIDFRLAVGDSDASASSIPSPKQGLQG